MNNCELGGADEWSPYLLGLHSVIAVGSFIGNSLVIYAVMRFTKLRTATNFFVTSLAIADLMVCFSLPYYVSFYLDVPYLCEKYPCLVRYSWSLFGALWSLLLMIGVAVDRYMAVLHPLRYAAWLQPRLLWSFCIGTGIYMAGVVTLPVSDAINKIDGSGMAECDLYYIVGPEYALPAVLFHVVLSMVVTSALYSKIFQVAWKQQRAIDAMLCRRACREHKITKMMGLILGVSIVALFPYFTVVSVRYAFPMTSQTHILSIAKKLCTVLFFAKSATNPFIYGWKNKEFRYAFRRILRCEKQITEGIPFIKPSPGEAKQEAKPSIHIHIGQDNVNNPWSIGRETSSTDFPFDQRSTLSYFPPKSAAI